MESASCSALVSSRWSVLASEGGDTITSITTGITRRRQEGSYAPGLGTSMEVASPFS